MIISLKYLALEKCNSLPNLDYDTRNPSLYLLEYMCKMKKWKLIVKLLKVIDHPYTYFRKMMFYCGMKLLLKEAFPTFYQMHVTDQEISFTKRNNSGMTGPIGLPDDTEDEAIEQLGKYELEGSIRVAYYACCVYYSYSSLYSIPNFHICYFMDALTNTYSYMFMHKREEEKFELNDEINEHLRMFLTYFPSKDLFKFCEGIRKNYTNMGVLPEDVQYLKSVVNTYSNVFEVLNEFLMSLDCRLDLTTYILNTDRWTGNLLLPHFVLANKYVHNIPEFVKILKDDKNINPEILQYYTTLGF